MTKRIAFLFPGQGAQYPGMGKDFADQFPVARRTFEEADDLLHWSISKLAFEGAEADLTATKNCQIALFVDSIAKMRVLQERYPHIQPTVCTGLSLGEYSALTAAHILSFADCLKLVERRAFFMHQSCEETQGTMAVVMGLEAEAVADSLRGLEGQVWIANLNCPGQIVISGTPKGIEEASNKLKEKNARRILPLNVHGAFHSGLMAKAEQQLAPYVAEANLQKSSTGFVMNVPGDYVTEVDAIRDNLVKQVTHSVLWEKGIRAIDQRGIDLFIEIGAGKTLAGLNKRIAPTAPTISIERTEDLTQVEKACS